jgi:hypothetical protein
MHTRALACIRRAGQGFEASGLIVTALSLAFNAEELVLHVSALQIQAAEDPTMMQQHYPIRPSIGVVATLGWWRRAEAL